mgnify:CR=1 FL=1
MGDREGVAPHPDQLPVSVVDNHTHLDIRRRDVADAIAPEGGDERTTQDVAAALAIVAQGDEPLLLARAAPAVVARFQYRPATSGTKAPTSARVT